jgi:hypothetical protein
VIVCRYGYVLAILWVYLFPRVVKLVANGDVSSMSDCAYEKQLVLI